MNIIIILLGCNIYKILEDRLNVLFMLTDNIINFNYHNTKKPILITIFLSGGIKNKFNGALSEASILKSQINNIFNLKYGTLYQNDVDEINILNRTFNFNNLKNPFINEYINIKFKFVLDEKSTNTAENFVSVSKFLNFSFISYEQLYIITSLFHKPRANLMMNLIDPSKKYKWILGDYEESDSKYWESVHINNIFSDVINAKKSIIDNYEL